MCRFICSLLLHMELIEDVRQGICMLDYLNTHPDLFQMKIIPLSICLMQMVGGTTAELTNLFMLATRDSVEYCITFFVAFHILTRIDNIYAEGLNNHALKQACEEPLVY
jgi:hypothetical protein